MANAMLRREPISVALAGSPDWITVWTHSVDKVDFQLNKTKFNCLSISMEFSCITGSNLLPPLTIVLRRAVWKGLKLKSYLLNSIQPRQSNFSLSFCEAPSPFYRGNNSSFSQALHCTEMPHWIIQSECQIATCQETNLNQLKFQFETSIARSNCD